MKQPVNISTIFPKHLFWDDYSGVNGATSTGVIGATRTGVNGATYSGANGATFCA